LYQRVKGHPAWHTELLTVLMTRKPDGSRIVTDADLDFERTVLQKKEALIRQEYFCDFEGDQEGSVYGDLLNQARLDGRVTAFGIEPGVPVIPVFDIGHHDATAVGFYQRVGPWRKLIDYVEASGKTVDYFAEVIKQKRFDLGYRYETVDGKILCIGPHDLRQKHWGSPHSAEEVARQYGLHFRVLPKRSVADGLAAGRRLFPRLWIHETAAARMLEIFGAYRYDWDAETQSFGSEPVHDWSSHGADQYRYFALSEREESASVAPIQAAVASFDPWTEAAYEFNPFTVGG
jgi:phage terminase large subunit